MRYFKVVTWTTGEDYETKEFYIDEIDFRKYQNALAGGNEFLMSDDRVIRRSQIKEIVQADGEIKEYLKCGLSLKTLNLPKREKLTEGDTIKKLWNKN